MHLCFSLVDQIGYVIKPVIYAKSCQNLVLYFIFSNVHHLSTFERTTRYRETGHILVSIFLYVHYSLSYIVWKNVTPLYQGIYIYVCSHSLNISSFYASHFCKKKPPKEKKQNKQTTKPKRKIPPKQTNKNVFPLYLYWRLRLCLNSMYVTSKVKGYKTLKT